MGEGQSEVRRGASRFDGIDRRFGFSRCGSLLAFPSLARPDMESPTAVASNFPGAPNSFTLAKTAIEDVMRPDVALGPVTLAIPGIVAAFDQEPPDIVNAFARHRAVYERKPQVHAVLFNPTKVVIVEPDPGARGK